MNDRRKFLKTVALLGAAATLPASQLFAQNQESPLPTGMKPVGDGLKTVSYGKEIRRPAAKPRVISIPDVDGHKILKGDFHIHTLFSDGHVMPKDRVAEAVENGLDVIALTEHIEYRPNIGKEPLRLVKNNNHNISHEFAKPVAEKANLMLVQGAEITKPAWHFNALFTEDINKIAAVVDDWPKMMAIAADQGAFIHWNHPSWLDRDLEDQYIGIKKGEPMRFYDEIEECRKKGHVHGVEVFNGTSFYPVALDWCNERDLAPIVNSDIHVSEWNMYGNQNPLRPMTLILAKDRSYDSVKEAFFAQRTVGWAANMILGRNPWVEKLFRACVAITKTGNGLTLKNKSDIPCLFVVGGTTKELAAQGTLELPAAKTLTVGNWFVGMNKPLEMML